MVAQAVAVRYPTNQVKRDYHLLWSCIGPRAHADHLPTPLPESALPTRRVMLGTICNHASGCHLCSKELGSRLSSYEEEMREAA